MRQPVRLPAILFILFFLCRFSAAEEEVINSRVEASLTNLKNDTEEVVASNRILSEKVIRFKERITELNNDLEKTQSSKERLDQKYQKVQEELKQQILETKSARQQLSTLQKNLSSDEKKSLQN